MPNLHHLILSDNERLSGPVHSFTVTFPALQSLSIQDVPLHLSVEWTAPSILPGFDNVSQVLLLPKQSHLLELGDALTRTPHTSPDRSSLRRGLHTDSWGAITNRGMTRRLTSTPNRKRILYYIFFIIGAFILGACAHMLWQRIRRWQRSALSSMHKERIKTSSLEGSQRNIARKWVPSVSSDAPATGGEAWTALPSIQSPTAELDAVQSPACMDKRVTLPLSRCVTQ